MKIVEKHTIEVPEKVLLDAGDRFTIQYEQWYTKYTAEGEEEKITETVNVECLVISLHTGIYIINTASGKTPYCCDRSFDTTIDFSELKKFIEERGYGKTLTVTLLENKKK